MVKRVDSLTPEQRARMPEWRDKWITHGLSTKAMTADDRCEVETAIRFIYEKAKLAPPKTILFVPSPFTLRVASGIAAGVIYAHRNGWPHGSFVRVAVDGAVRGAVDGAVDGAVGGAVDGAVGVAVRGAVGVAVRGAVGGAVRYLLLCAQQAYNMDSQYFWWRFGWTSYCTFFTEVCGLEIEEADALAAIEAIDTRAGNYSVHADFAMVSDRPSLLRRDAGGRLHADIGPAIAWRDGWYLCFWHGLQIPRSHEWILDRAALTPDKIEAEPNAELRRVMLEVFGFENYLAARQAKLIAADDLHGQPRRLIEIAVAGEKLRVIEVVNGSIEADGTRRKFHLGAARRPGDRAQPKTPAEAVANSYGIAADHYREAVRT